VRLRGCWKAYPRSGWNLEYLRKAYPLTECPRLGSKKEYLQMVKPKECLQMGSKKEYPQTGLNSEFLLMGSRKVNYLE